MDNKVILPISVIIPCYRCSDVLYRAVESVFKQTSLPQEVIMIDDFSDDNNATVNTIHKIYEDYSQSFSAVSIKVILLNKNGGPGKARNEGWNIAIGDYIAFLDADDSWHTRKLEYQYSFLCNHTEITLCGHKDAVFDEKLAMQTIDKCINYKMVSYDSLFIKNEFLTRTAMIKKNIVIRFDNLYRGEDYLLWLKILYEGEKGCVLPEALAFTYVEERDHLTRNILKAHKGEIDAVRSLKIERKVSFTKYIFIRIWFSIKFFRRTIMYILK